MTRIAVLDYGSGNLLSAARALARTGAEVTVTSDPQDCIAADGLVVPGVGAFDACMSGLRSVDGERIIDHRLAGARPILGICVGMQILFDRGVEHGVETIGCGQLPGDVVKLDSPVLPHMGWNTVDAAPDSTLFRGVDSESRVYFVHSYAVRSWTVDSVFGLAPAVSWSSYGGRFVAAVELGVLSATQFHPEKSGEVGRMILQNWVDTL